MVPMERCSSVDGGGGVVVVVVDAIYCYCYCVRICACDHEMAKALVGMAQHLEEVYDDGGGDGDDGGGDADAEECVRDELWSWAHKE
jgi:hypothetical protein